MCQRLLIDATGYCCEPRYILKALFEQSRPVSETTIHDVCVNEIKVIGWKDPRLLDFVDYELVEPGVSVAVASFHTDARTAIL